MNNGDRQILIYASQRHIVLDADAHPMSLMTRLTARQYRRAMKRLRQRIYAPRPRSASVPF